MLIPHLHFNGDCKKAIILYEEAFNTKIDDIDCENENLVNHASMKIHGQTVFLNDNNFFANKNNSSNFPIHLIIQFKTTEELLSCYKILKQYNEIKHPFIKTSYSELVGNFVDKFGIWWGFMVV